MDKNKQKIISFVKKADLSTKEKEKLVATINKKGLTKKTAQKVFKIVRAEKSRHQQTTQAELAEMKKIKQEIAKNKLAIDIINSRTAKNIQQQQQKYREKMKELDKRLSEAYKTTLQRIEESQQQTIKTSLDDV
ncbi:MAG: hypothetical protein HQ530_02265 [Parcubacteria group bacterium]|nr:hypothetical protein [Parcubacteria group bacterium]